MTTQVVGVARTGGLTTTVVNTVTGMTDPAKEPDLEPSAGLLATAVSGLCTLPDAGNCAVTPKLKEASPVPVGRHPSLLVEADLPPVPTIEQPWVGTQPTKAKENLAATRCDDTQFTGPGFSKSLTRTFVIPAATQLPPEFGLSETVGALPPKQAHAFIERHPRQAHEVSRRRPRHRGREARRGGERPPRPLRLAAHRRGVRGPLRALPDGRHPRGRRGRAAHLRALRGRQHRRGPLRHPGAPRPGTAPRSSPPAD